MSRMHSLTGKLLESVSHGQLFAGGERLLVAVSGGVDSMVLLHLLCHMPKPRRPEISVAHFDHRLRGKDSEGDAQFTEGVCQAWGVPFFKGTAAAWKSKSNLQARARTLRYQFLYETAERLGIGTIATGHQATDQAETFLIRWIQGAGLRGLTGIPLKKVEGKIAVIRPLLMISRDEILAYAKDFDVTFREDRSNSDPRYLRTRIRGITKLLVEIQPGLSHRAAVNAIFLRADEEYLDRMARDLYKKFFDAFDVKDQSFPIPIYCGLPDALRYRLLKKIGEESGNQVLSGEKILKLDRLIRDPLPSSSYSLGRGVRFFKDYIKFGLSAFRSGVDLKDRRMVRFG